MCFWKIGFGSSSCSTIVMRHHINEGPQIKFKDTPSHSTACRPCAKRQMQSSPHAAHGEDRKAQGRAPVPWIERLQSPLEKPFHWLCFGVCWRQVVKLRKGQLRFGLGWSMGASRPNIWLLFDINQVAKPCFLPSLFPLNPWLQHLELGWNGLPSWGWSPSRKLRNQRMERIQWMADPSLCHEATVGPKCVWISEIIVGKLVSLW